MTRLFPARLDSQNITECDDQNTLVSLEKVSIQEKKRLLFALSLLLTLVGFGILQAAWVCDDSFITFRSVRNFLAGDGLRWNLTERVQVFTHPLWFLLISFCIAITGEYYFTTIGISILLSLGAAITLSIRARTYCVLLVPIALLSSHAFIDFSTSGLETPLSYLLATLFFTRFLKNSDSIWLFFIAALGVFTRADHILLYFTPLLFLLFKNFSTTYLVKGMLAFAPLMVWNCFALFYYGALFPNTYYAKVHTGLSKTVLIEQGILYLLDSLTHDPLTIILIVSTVVSAFALGDRRARITAIGVCCYLGYTISVGGDFMSGRFLAVPFVVTTAMMGTYDVPLSIRHASYFGLLFVIIPFWGERLHPLHNHLLPDEKVISPNGIAQERQFYLKQYGLLYHTKERQIPPPEWRHRAERGARNGVSIDGFAGASGFGASKRTHVLDPLALTDPLLARLPIMHSVHWRPGHYPRSIPSGYLRSLQNNTNEIVNPDLAEFYEYIRIITRSSLLSFSRLIVIARMHVGSYDYLLERYLHKGERSIPLTLLEKPIVEGKQWDLDSEILRNDQGIAVELGRLRYDPTFEIGVDHNDAYRISYWNGSHLVASHHSIPGMRTVGGIEHRDVVVPERALRKGYDAIHIHIASGDPLGSVHALNFPERNSSSKQVSIMK